MGKKDHYSDCTHEKSDLNQASEKWYMYYETA